MTTTGTSSSLLFCRLLQHRKYHKLPELINALKIWEIQKSASKFTVYRTNLFSGDAALATVIYREPAATKIWPSLFCCAGQ